MANDGSSHVQDGVGDAASRRELIFARCALAAIVLAAVLARAGGLNPSTLWFDDVWVAALAKLPSAWAALSAPAPAPPGFVLLLWGVDKIGLDPEWGLQFVPFLAALATIPLVGHLVRRLTGSPWTGLLAAALMAMSPWLAYYSTNVKQYSLDALITLLLVEVSIRFFAKETTLRDLVLLATGALLALFFSLYSIFLYGALIAVVVARFVIRSSEPWQALGRALILVAVYGGAIAAFYVTLIQPRSATAIQDYWQSYFMPLGFGAGTIEFLALRGGQAVTGALPPAVGGVALMALPGLAWLIVARRWRPVGAMITLLLVGLPIASHLHLYPMGGARTDIFFHPVLILLVALGVHAVTSVFAQRRYHHHLVVMPAVFMLFVAVFNPVPSSYPPADQLETLDHVFDAVARGEPVIVMPAAQWSLAYYGPWAYSVKREPQSSTSFVIVLSDGGPLMLPLAGAQEIARKLDRLIEDRQRTIHLVESRTGILPEKVNLPALVESRGYREHYERRDVQIQVTTYRFRPNQRSLATAGR